MIPPPLSAHDDYDQLARVVSKYILLPNPDVARTLDYPVFPTFRDTGRRGEEFYDDTARLVAMSDDNTTPRWAIIWSHGVRGRGLKKILDGWSVAHVWDDAKDRDIYTRLANLALVPKAFASLTDGDGPLTAYLRYHAFAKYAWYPANKAKPRKPDEYDSIEWRYLECTTRDPCEFVRQELHKGDCKRAKILKKLML